MGVSAYLSFIGGRRAWALFEAGRSLTFSAFGMGTYSRWALIRGWALIRIITVIYRTGFIPLPKGFFGGLLNGEAYIRGGF